MLCETQIHGSASDDRPWWHSGDSARFGIDTLRSRVTEPRRRHVHILLEARTPYGELQCFETTIQKQDVSISHHSTHPLGGQV